MAEVRGEQTTGWWRRWTAVLSVVVAAAALVVAPPTEDSAWAYDEFDVRIDEDMWFELTGEGPCSTREGGCYPLLVENDHDGQPGPAYKTENRDRLPGYVRPGERYEAHVRVRLFDELATWDQVSWPAGTQTGESVNLYDIRGVVTGPCNFSYSTAFDVSETRYTTYVLTPRKLWMRFPEMPVDACDGQYTVEIQVRDGDAGTGSFLWSSSDITDSATATFWVSDLAPPIPQMQVDEGVSSGPDPVAGATQADPVNTTNGSLVDARQDLVLPDLGVTLPIARVYDSTDTEVGLLGPGWRSSVEFDIVLDGNDRPTVRAGNGRQEYFDLPFTESPDGTQRTFASSTVTTRSLTADLDVGTGEWVYSYGNARVVTRWSAGRLVDSTRLDTGDTFTFVYDETTGRISRLQGPTRHIDLTYTTEGLLETAIADDGRQVTYGYTAQGQLETATSPGGTVETYGYDTAGRMASAHDGTGVLLHQTSYDADGRVVSQLDAAGGETTVEYRLRDVAAWTGDVVTTDPAGGEWVDSYHNGILIHQTRPSGRYVGYGWNTSTDGTPYLETIATPDGTTEITSVSSGGYPLQVTGTDGRQWTSGLNAQGQLDSFSGTGSKQVTRSYTAEGWLDVVSTSTGRTIDHNYDTAGNPTSITDSTSEQVTYTHDAVGRVTSVTSPTLGATTRTYTPQGWLDTETGPDGTLDLDYDLDGRIVRAQLPTGRVLTRDYDDAGRLLTETDDGETTTYGYDQHGRLETVTDKHGTTAVTYTSAGLVGTRTYTDGSSQTYSHDTAGQVTEIVDRLGSHLFDHDQAGRLASTTAPDGASRTFSYGTAAGGDSPSAITYGDGRQTTYSYSNTGVRTGQAGPDPNDDVTYTHGADQLVSGAHFWTNPATTYQYDAADRLTQRTNPLGPVDTWARDPAGRLDTTSRDGQPVVDRTYATDGLIETQTFGDGTVETYAYDSRNRLIDRTVNDAGGATIDREQITYDTRDNVTVVQTETGVSSYAYDARDRLVRACYAITVCDQTVVTDFEAFTYTPEGDRATRTTQAGTDTYHYDTKRHLTRIDLADGSSRQFTYDGAGRLTSDGDWTYTWDQQLGLLTTAETTGVRYELDYNTLGQLEKLTQFGDGPTGGSLDTDGDGIDDATDNCPDTANADQADADGDGIGDACDDDSGGGDCKGGPKNCGTSSTTTASATTSATSSPPLSDRDGDGIDDLRDNCPHTANADQRDHDGDGPGDLCDPDGECKGGPSKCDPANDPTVKITTFEYDPYLGDLTAIVKPDGQRTALLPDRAGIDTPIREYYHRDRLGTPSATTATGQGAQNLDTPTAFGSNAPVTDDLRSHNGYLDLDIGSLLWTGNRWYDPSIGRFTSLDPAGQGYKFALDSPLTYTDPTGLIPCLGSMEAARACLKAVASISAVTGAVPGIDKAKPPLANASDTTSIAADGTAVGSSGFTGYDSCVAAKGSCATAVVDTATGIGAATTSAIGRAGSVRTTDDALASAGAGSTRSRCLSFDLVGFGGAQGDICHTSDSHGNTGVTSSGGIAVGWNIGIGYTEQVSTADSIDELVGPAWQCDGSYGPIMGTVFGAPDLSYVGSGGGAGFSPFPINGSCGLGESTLWP